MRNLSKFYYQDYYTYEYNYSSSEWLNLVKDEMANGPVVFAGTDDYGGHMFVLDGYTTMDYFHVNWGWGGYSNGYYKINALEPADQGVGANMGSYNDWQSVIVNFRKSGIEPEPEPEQNVAEKDNDVPAKVEVSIDEPLNVDWDGNELLLCDILGTDENVVTGPLEDDVDLQILRQALRELSDREREIVCMRFGLEGRKELTQKEVAQKMGISQSYISRLEKRIMLRLKKEFIRQTSCA